MSRRATLDEELAADVAPGTGCYVYGVVSSDTVLPDDLAGLDDAPVRSVTDAGVPGLAAVVADVALDRPPGRRKELLAHSAVLDTLASGTVVVPVRFGSLMPDEQSVVEDVLAPNAELFADYLADLAGRTQYTLRASYQPDVALAEVVAADPEVADLSRRTRGLAEEQGYAMRVRLGELVSRAMEAKREEDAAVLLDAVVGHVAAHTVRGGGGLDHVLDVALLVDDDGRDELEEHLEQLAEAVHERIRLRLMGPMAPYDFVEGG